MKSPGSNQVVLQGKLGHDDLYVFKGLPIVKSSTSDLVSSSLLSNNTISPTIHSVTTLASPTSHTLWHGRLGHANSQVVSHIIKLCNMNSSNKSVSKFCNACQLGKTHRIHAPPSSRIIKLKAHGASNAKDPKPQAHGVIDATC